MAKFVRLSSLLVAVVAGVLLLRASGREPTAAELLKNVAARYLSLPAYESQGEVIAVVDMTEGMIDVTLPPEKRNDPEQREQARQAIDKSGQAKGTLQRRFRMRMARSGAFRVEWTDGVKGDKSAGVAASDGTTYDVQLGANPEPFHPKDATTALSMASSISSGVAATIPAVFLGLDISPLSKVVEAQFQPEETIDGEPCWVVKTLVEGRPVTFWISKQRKLILKAYSDVQGRQEEKDLSEEEFQQSLRDMGVGPTPGLYERMKKGQAQQRAITRGMTGHMQEVHTAIAVDRHYEPTDFKLDNGTPPLAIP